MRTRIILMLMAVVAVMGLLQSSASAKVSPECTADPHLTTFIGGTIEGYPDGRALDTHVGVLVGYKDADGKFKGVTAEGQPTVGSNYSWVDRLNPSVPAGGTTDETAPDGTPVTKNWGMCVWGGVTTYHTEMYPKAPVDETHDPEHQVTDKSRYGASAYYAGTVTSGDTVNLLLRLPTTYQFSTTSGNTGGMQGYLTYQGEFVPATAISRVRAFPGPGATCGVEGYSAAADQLTTAVSPDRTYYRLDYLAGGQCGAVAQNYSFQWTCAVVCGAPSKTFIRNLPIVKGTVPRVDVSFG